MKLWIGAFVLPLAIAATSPALADQLYTGGSFAKMASDNRAQAVGDIVTIVIFEAASATNRVRNRSGKDTSLSGSVDVGGINEGGDLRLGGSYSGTGEVERSDQLVATMAAHVIGITANGDFLIEGQQDLFVNDERRNITVRGQIRPIDISSQNTVASSRLANAQIKYDGEGFASRSARPGIINRILSLLGLG